MTVQVKRNDQLGKIVQSLGFKIFLYGKDGLIARVLKYNPHIKNPDQIEIGDLINLPQTKEDLYSYGVVKDTEEIPAPKYTTAIKPENLDEYEDSWTIRVGPELSLWRRSVAFTTTSGTVNSDIIYGAYADFLIPINSNWTLDNSIQYRHIKFNGSDSRTISSDSQSFVLLSTGLERALEKFHLGGGISFETIPFVVASSSSVVTVESFSILSPYLKADYLLKRSRKTDFTLGLIGSYFMSSTGSSSYNFDGGYGLKIYIDATRRLTNGHGLSLIPFLELQSADTTYVKHSDYEYGMKLLYGWKL